MIRELFQAREDRRQPEVQAGQVGGNEVRLRLSRTVDGHALLTAAAADLAVRKEVHADGCFHCQIDRGRDRLALAVSPGRVTLTYGTKSVALSVGAREPVAVLRARELLIASPVAAEFRRLGLDLERQRALHPPLCALRLAATVLSQIDGDETAVHRLSAALIHSSSPSIDSSHGAMPARRVFDDRVRRACADLERTLDGTPCGSTHWAASSLAWVLCVEAAWCALTLDERSSDR